MLKGVQVMFKSVLFWKIVTLLGLMLLMMIPKRDAAACNR